MFTWMWIFEIVLFCAIGRWRALATPPPNLTTCEEFERGARFNPYEVLDSQWKIFYFWADNTELYPILFTLPTEKRLHKFKETIDAIEPGLGVEWNKATLFMNPRPGTEVLFLYAGTPGAFRALVIKEQRQKKVRPYPVPLMKLADVRLKMVGNYIGMICCEDLSSYALSKMDFIPSTEKLCVEAAASLGLRGPNGMSYLYLKRKIADEL